MVLAFYGWRWWPFDFRKPPRWLKRLRWSWDFRTVCLGHIWGFGVSPTANGCACVGYPFQLVCPIHASVPPKKEREREAK